MQIDDFDLANTGRRHCGGASPCAVQNGTYQDGRHSRLDKQGGPHAEILRILGEFRTDLNLASYKRPLAQKRFSGLRSPLGQGIHEANESTEGYKGWPQGGSEDPKCGPKGRGFHRWQSDGSLLTWV